ncbi:hypothetical protein GCM10022381_41100 [Leifsonia kafniensis]|uniref:Uncharacterized protein n=1 Tax=Leifsonia kafniensis TaxID=475957 RepID=A0ABP7L6T4_9MICO
MVKNPSGPDEEITAFRDRDLAALDHPNMFLDAAYCKARVKHRMAPRRSSLPSVSPSTGAEKRPVLMSAVNEASKASFVRVDWSLTQPLDPDGSPPVQVGAIRQVSGLDDCS